MKLKKCMCLFVMLFFCCFISGEFNKTINISVEYKKYATPANLAFKDDNFYKCIIDAYNEEFAFLDYVPKLTYNDVITDEQLNEIERLNCHSSWYVKDVAGNIIRKSFRVNENGSSISGEDVTRLGLDIKDITGIDKLKNLKSVSFSYDSFNTFKLDNSLIERIYLNEIELENIDLSNNISLKELILNNNNLFNIDLSYNKSLEYVNLEGNNLTNIDVSNNVLLNSLSLEYNNISEIDLSKNVNLLSLYLSNNNLKIIDFSNNKLLWKVVLENNKLSDIRFSDTSALVYLDAANNNLSNIDLGMCSSLESLYLYNNNFENIDLSNCLSLKVLNIHTNNLDDINLTNNILLEEVELGSNRLTNINLNNNVELKKLGIIYNLISSIDLSKNINLETVWLEGNNFTFLDFSNNKKLNLTNSRINQNKTFYLFVGDTYVFDNEYILNYLKSNYNEYVDVEGNSVIFKYIYDYYVPDIQIGSYINPQGETVDMKSTYKFYTIGLRDVNNKYFISNKKQFFYTGNDIDNEIILNNVYISMGIFDKEYGEIKNGKYIIDLHGIYKEYDILNVSSDVYDLNSSYIFDSISNVQKNIDLGNIKFNNCGYEFDYVNDYLNIINGEDYVALYYLVNYVINKYAYNDKYILVDDNDISAIIKNIDCNHCLARVNDGYNNLSEGEINDNYKLVLKLNSIDANNFKQYDIINIDSKYNINYDESYIHVGTEIDSSIILSNIKLSEISGVNGILKNNKYIVMANNEVIKEFNIVNYTSDKYDLSNDFIKVNDSDISSFISNFECANCSVKVYDGSNYLESGEFGENYKLVFMLEDEVLKEYDLKYSVMGLDISDDNLKLNLSNDNIFKLSVDIYPSFIDDKTIFWTSSDINVATVDSEGVVTAKSIGSAVITATSIDGVTDICRVEVSDTVLYNVTYKDGNNIYTERYEEGDKVSLKLDLSKNGYKLIGWTYGTSYYKLSDEFKMPGNDIELIARWQLIIPEVKNYEVNNNNINGISLNTDINNIDLGIDDIYDVKVYNHDNKSKLSGLIGTGDKVKIYLDSTLVSEYDVIIKGDLNGDGETKIGDIAKLYQYFKNVISMDECYIKAGNVVDSDDIIKIGDVAKLYQFFKKTIDSL